MGYRQVIIVRKYFGEDKREMSKGKMMAQCNHASMAFLTTEIRKSARFMPSENKYEAVISFDPDLFTEWINGPFTKTVCEAKNKTQLLKAVTIAEELGLKEGEDYFLVRDNCYTELEPEDFDQEGKGTTLTCIGFKPLPDETAHKISKKFQLYK